MWRRLSAFRNGRVARGGYARLGLHGLCVQREEQHRIGDRYRQMDRHQDHQGRPAAARHRVHAGRQVRAGRGRRRRHDPGDRCRDASRSSDTLPSGPDPELFTQDAAGKILYVANENDNTVTIIDRRKARPHRRDPGRRRAGGHGASARTARSWSTRPRPPTWRISSTPRRARSSPTCWSMRGRALPSSSATAPKCGYRPRSAAPCRVIDPVKREVTRQDHLQDSRPAARGDPAGRHRHHQGRQDRLRRARPRQPRRGRRCHDPQGDEISAGRPAGLAHGVHPGREISAGHQRRVERRLGDRRAPRKR